MDNLLLKPLEVAETLRISRGRVYELIKAGVIPSVRVGCALRVPAEALREWVAAQQDRGDK